jgi:hypothetical protein
MLFLECLSGVLQTRCTSTPGAEPRDLIGEGGEARYRDADRMAQEERPELEGVAGGDSDVKTERTRIS